MELTIFGATGATGTCLTEQALVAGHDVTAVVRDPARLSVPGSPRLRVITADLMDPAAISPAVAGAGAVLAAFGPHGTGPTTVLREGARSVIEAMHKEGTRRLVSVSGSIVTDEGEGPAMRYLLKPVFRGTLLRHANADMRGAEDVIRQSGLDWTIMRPPRLTSEPASGAYRTAIDRNLPHGVTVSRADVAACMLGVIGDPATIHGRQRVHAALAAVIDPAADPDRRAWQLAVAARGLDETVAAELEQAGDRARRRGGWTTAEAFYKRAAMLSGDQPARARRMLSAAEASCDGGTPLRAQAMLDEAAAYRDPRHHGLAGRLQGRIWHTMRRPADATAALLSAATELGPIDIRLARDILVEAVVEAQINGQLAPDGATGADVALVAQSLPVPRGTPASVSDLLLDADMSLQLHGLPAVAPQLRRAIDAARREAGTAPEIFQWLAAACSDATILADDIALHELAWRMEAQAREQGAAIALSLARGRYEHAYASLAEGIHDGSQIKFALPDLVEAAQRSGHRDAAQRLTGQLADLAEVSPVPRTLGFLARARALTARDARDAEPHYRAAIQHHGQTRGPAHRARSHLVYGEWLRRARRPRDAREQLRTAYRLFGEMGAQGFAARARLELSAAGEPAGAAAAEVDHGLTPQEARVASLAAAGATNAEIAAQLYLSANTVDYHLRKVFRKLGVTSRRQLTGSA